MEEIFGHRPPALSTDTEPDTEPDTEEQWHTSNNVVDDVQGGIQEIQSVKTEIEPLILTEASHESSSSSSSSTQQSTAPGALKRTRSCCAAMHSQYQGFLERLQRSQNTWLEHRLEQSHVREERLIARVLSEHTRSVEALVSQLFSGWRSLLPPSHPDPHTLSTQPAEQQD